MPLRMPWTARIAVGGQAFAQALMIGMPPATAASKASATPLRSAAARQLGAVMGQQRLVGGDDVLAAVSAVSINDRGGRRSRRSARPPHPLGIGGQRSPASSYQRTRARVDAAVGDGVRALRRP